MSEQLTELQSAIAIAMNDLNNREPVQNEISPRPSINAHCAVMDCDIRPEHKHVLRAAMRAQGLSEDWNDREGRTKEEVLLKFQKIEITDETLALTFGPPWREVLELVRRAAMITADEAARMVATQSTNMRASADTWLAASSAAWNDDVWAAAHTAAAEALPDDGKAARGAVMDAAAALVARQRIGQFGFTQARFDLMVKPWESVTGMNLH